MSDLWDYESRWETSTRTDGGYYDQVIALSQGLINENFKKLYDIYKADLGKVYLKDAAIGTFEGEVEAPRILIPGADEPSANLNEVIFQIRFTSGSLKDGTGKATIPNLKGWTFAVRAPVVPETLADPKTLTDAEAKKQLEAKVKRIKDRFEYPGDYSVERLYLKLSAANWGAMDYTRTIAGLDSNGKELPYLNWSLKNENQSAALRLTFWLGVWGDRLGKDSMNSLGLSFKSPTSVKIPRKYVPTEVLHQVYQYKSKKNGSEKGQTGFNGAGNSNCLLYLEMVQGGGPRPTDPRLIWSGNFATQDGGPAHPPIRATYLLSRDIFFDQIILPEFRALNRASDVYYDPLFFLLTDGKNSVNMAWRIGYDPRYPTDSDGTYDFKPVADPLNPLKVVSYQWTKRNQQNDGGPHIAKQALDDSWGRVSTDVTMKSTVTWATGGTEITLQGATTVQEDCEWTSNENDWANSTSHFHDKYVVTWSLKLRIVPKYEKYEKTDVMVSYLDIDVDQEVKTNVNPTLNQSNVEMNGHDSQLLEGLRARIGEQFSRIIGNIRQTLNTSGRYTYPGNGKLIFEKPGIGKYGDLNAQVRFAPLSKEDWIIVPSSEPTKPETPVAVNPTPHTVRPTISDLQLAWKLGSLKALAADQTLRVHAVNETSNKLYFATLTFTFRTGKRQGGLFLGDEFVYTVEAAKEDGKKPVGNADKTLGSGEAKSSNAPPALTEARATTKLDETKTTKPDETQTTESKTVTPPKTETKKPAPPKGVIGLLKGPGQQDCKVEVNPQAVEHGLTPWEIQISTVAGNTLALAPGAWIELSITSNSSLSGQHEVQIDESIRDDQGADIGHFPKTFEVTVS